jgi:hypothetical protein
MPGESMPRKSLPAEALLDLRRRLSAFPARSPSRRVVMKETAALYGISEAALYRALHQHVRPKSLRRADCGQTRSLPTADMERYCELIAAIKLRTSNKQGRCLSTGEAIRLLEEHGMKTPDGFIQPARGLLKVTTVNSHLKRWGYDRSTLLRQPPAVRFQAQHSNDCWQFDLSPSDLKHINKPSWVRDDGGNPQLMLYSVVDDRSGAAYMEYHCVYGEDVEAGLRFLFNAMAAKSLPGMAFQGIPKMIYTDNGPIARSQIFQKVLGYLGVELRTHIPAGKDGRRVTARSKGKVERPFRTVKEMYETLFHFHEPQTEEEANAGLRQYLLRYNDMNHRTEPHSRMQDWLENLPPSGIREMCAWERFCTFAREPERRKVGADARVAVDGVAYEVDSDLAGEAVVLWWGLFDHELYVEHGDKRSGPYYPTGGPIPLHRYRSHKKTNHERRAERVEALAGTLELARAAVLGGAAPIGWEQPAPPADKPVVPFTDPDPFQEFTFTNAVAAKRAIADYLALPLAKLTAEQRSAIEETLARTMNKREIRDWVRQHVRNTTRR